MNVVQPRVAWTNRPKNKIIPPTIGRTTFDEEHIMTGYTVHSGTTVKFSESWDRIFPASEAKSSKSAGTAKKKAASGPAKAKARSKRAAKKKR